MRKSLVNTIKEIAIKMKGPIPKRILGKTGLRVTQLGLGGGSPIASDDPKKHEEILEFIRTAVDMGINYIDTAAAYGPSEEKIGEALDPETRKSLIIATKTGDRTYDGCMRLLERSLKRLQTDYIDIWQLHHPEHEEEVEKISSSKGAMKALNEAKERGLVRYIGLTGHYDPKPLKTLINRFDFDTALITLNPADVHKHSFKEELLPLAVEKELGIIGMKITCLGRIFHPGKLNSMKEALYYTLSLPIATAIVGHNNLDQLYENILLAQNFEQLSASEMKELEDKTKSYAHLACFFRKGNEKYNPFWKAYPQEKKK